MREDFDRFLQRLQAFWRSFCNSQNRVRLLVAVGLLGMGLILCSELLAGEEPKKSEPAHGTTGAATEHATERTAAAAAAGGDYQPDRRRGGVQRDAHL